MMKMIPCDVCHHSAWADLPEKNYEPGKEGAINHLMINGGWHVCEYCRLLKLYGELIKDVKKFVDKEKEISNNNYTI